MHASPADDQQRRADALRALGRDQCLRLMAWANICGRRSGSAAAAGEDLLQSAYERWLRSDTDIGGSLDTARYLMGAIRSIASNEGRDAKTDAMGYLVEQDADAVNNPMDTAAGKSAADDAAREAQSSAFVQSLYDQLGHEPELQLLILYRAQDLPRREIQQELGWDDKKYDAVEKRRTRAAAKLMREGKL